MDLTFLEWALQNQPETPEGELDGVKITHEEYEAGHQFQVISPRNFILGGGEKPLQVRFPDPYIVRKLTYEGGTWMTNLPQEIWQMKGVIGKPHGKILVAGLGLGIASHLLSIKGEVVHTIEKDYRVVALVAPTITSRSQHTIITADFYDYARNLKAGQFDHAFLDIWQPTGERVWVSDIVPLRRLLRNKIGSGGYGRIFCWAEDEMKGQLRPALFNTTIAPTDMRWGLGQYNLRAFQEVATRMKLCNPAKDEKEFMDKRIENEIRSRSNEKSPQRDLIDFYLTPGTDAWEATFGKTWDRLKEEDDKRRKELGIDD